MTETATVPKVVDATKEAATADGSRRLYFWVGALVAAGAVVWCAGWLAFQGTGGDAKGWNTVWTLSAVSFLFAFLPLPGVTSALLLSLRNSWLLGGLGVLGAAIGGTAAAGLLLALGDTGRDHLEKRATKSKRAKKALEWSKRLASKWTYAGVFLLLVPQFIPRAAVLYAAVLARLKTAPFLAVVFAGTFVRNLVMLAGFSLIP